MSGLQGQESSIPAVNSKVAELVALAVAPAVPVLTSNSLDSMEKSISDLQAGVTRLGLR